MPVEGIAIISKWRQLCTAGVIILLCYSLPTNSLRVHRKEKCSGMSPAIAPTLQLNNGQEIPALGLGTWQGTAGSGEVKAAVLAALDAGYRHIDTAACYLTEEDIGVAIKKKISQGDIKREELFITTKLWITHFEPEMVVKACQNSCKKLGLDYVDLYLIHWPFGIKGKDVEDLSFEGEESNVSLEETWRGMEKCVEKGFAKSIGLSNFNSVQIKRILDCAKIKPVNLQIEVHPYLNQRKLIDYCKKQNITVTAYSPLGAPWTNPDKPLLINDPVLKEIADKYRKSPAQVVLRYLIQSGTIPIPKSGSPQRIQENIDVFDFKLEQADVEKIDALDQKARACLLSPHVNATETSFQA
uniref:Alcohol dehydrogenase [NADP(+)] A n=2 Tax=Cacopsylla melanoneura TaxID=428564 RepID=A0A8D8XTW5_9HEMI